MCRSADHEGNYSPRTRLREELPMYHMSDREAEIDRRFRRENITFGALDVDSSTVNTWVRTRSTILPITGWYIELIILLGYVISHIKN